MSWLSPPDGCATYRLYFLLVFELMNIEYFLYVTCSDITMVGKRHSHVSYANEKNIIFSRSSISTGNTWRSCFARKRGAYDFFRLNLSQRKGCGAFENTLWLWWWFWHVYPWGGPDPGFSGAWGHGMADFPTVRCIFQHRLFVWFP